MFLVNEQTFLKYLAECTEGGLEVSLEAKLTQGENFTFNSMIIPHLSLTKQCGSYLVLLTCLYCMLGKNEGRDKY